MGPVTVCMHNYLLITYKMIVTITACHTFEIFPINSQLSNPIPYPVSFRMVGVPVLALIIEQNYLSDKVSNASLISSRGSHHQQLRISSCSCSWA